MQIGHYTIPYFVQHYICAATRRTLYRLVDYRGQMVAEGIEDAQLARQFCCAPCVVRALDSTFELACTDMHNRWDFGWGGPDFEELADDEDGEFEERFAGAPGHARLLLGFSALLDYAQTCS